MSPIIVQATHQGKPFLCSTAIGHEGLVVSGFSDLPFDVASASDQPFRLGHREGRRHAVTGKDKSCMKMCIDQEKL